MIHMIQTCVVVGTFFFFKSGNPSKCTLAEDTMFEFVRHEERLTTIAVDTTIRRQDFQALLDEASSYGIDQYLP